MINLTDMGWEDHEQSFFNMYLTGVTLDIYTPEQSVTIFGLVYRDPNEPRSDNIVKEGGDIAIGTTAAIIGWKVSQWFGAGIIGPEGVIIAIIATETAKAIYHYIQDQQQESFGESSGGNWTHRQIWYNTMCDMPLFTSIDESKSHIVFVGLCEGLPRSCGAIKLVLKGQLVMHWINVVWNDVQVVIGFEMGIVIPIFVW